MPAVKDKIALMSAVALPGGGGPTSSGSVDLRTAYGAIFYVTVTNGVNRLGQGVVVQLEVAPDQIAGNEIPFDCRHVAGQQANEVSKFAIRVPPEVQFARATVAHGDDAATIDVAVDRLTQV
jgi:hypothetical protein